MGKGHSLKKLRRLLRSGEIDRSLWMSHFPHVLDKYVPDCYECTDYKTMACSGGDNPIDCFRGKSKVIENKTIKGSVLYGVDSLNCDKCGKPCTIVRRGGNYTKFRCVCGWEATSSWSRGWEKDAESGEIVETDQYWDVKSSDD